MLFLWFTYFLGCGTLIIIYYEGMQCFWYACCFYITSCSYTPRPLFLCRLLGLESTTVESRSFKEKGCSYNQVLCKVKHPCNWMLYYSNKTYTSRQNILIEQSIWCLVNLGFTVLGNKCPWTCKTSCYYYWFCSCLCLVGFRVWCLCNWICLFSVK